MATASDKGTIIRVFSVPAARKLYQFRRGSMPSRIYSMSFNATSSLLCVSSTTDTVHIFKLGTSPPRPTSGHAGHTNAPLSPQLRDRSLSPASDSQPDLMRTTSNGSVDATSPSRKHNGTLLGMIRRTSQNVSTSFAASVGAYLPAAVSEMWEPARDFAWLKIPKGAHAGGPAGSAGGGVVGGGGGGGLGAATPLRSVVAMCGHSPRVMVVTNEGRFLVFDIDLERGGEGKLWKVYEVGGESERLGGGGVDGSGSGEKAQED